METPRTRKRMLPALEIMDDIRGVLDTLPGPDVAARAAAREREPTLTKPPGALGRLEDLAEWLAAWQGRHPPGMATVRARLFAGNHGVVAQGVSAYPAEVTAQMVANFEAGGAAVNQLCQTMGVELAVDALALERPTGDITVGPAMDESQFMDAFRFGFGSVPDGTDLLALGEMGIGNTTSAAAICHQLHGGRAADWTGPGTGVAGSALEAKIKAVERAVRDNGTEAMDPLDALRRLGGRELAAIAGAVLGARLRRVPVLLDGFVCLAAAAPLAAQAPGTLDHCQAAHVSAEPGHRRLLDALGMTPLLDLGMRLGEGSGAVLAVALVRAAAQCHAGMATFADAGVSGRDD